MDPEIVALASATGGAILKAMATDAWELVRDRTASLFARGDAQARQREVERLDHDKNGVISAELVPDTVAGRLQGRLELLMDEDPRIVGKVRLFAEEIRRSTEAAGTAVVQNANNNKRSTVYQAGRDIVGGLGDRR